MPCIEMPEVAYLYVYLLVSALENTPEYGPILGYFAVTAEDSDLGRAEEVGPQERMIAKPLSYQLVGLGDKRVSQNHTNTGVEGFPIVGNVQVAVRLYSGGDATDRFRNA
jgi:hypothetical protein